MYECFVNNFIQTEQSLPHTLKDYSLLILFHNLHNFSCEEKFKLNSTDPLVLDECEIMMKRLQADYSEEYRAFEVCQLAVVILFPFVSIKSHLIQVVLSLDQSMFASYI